MEYQGLVQKFKINRPLAAEEKKLQLLQGQLLEVDPVHQRSVVKLNSTFLEAVDKYFSWKGMVTFFAIALLLMFAVAFAGLSYLFFGPDSARFNSNEALATYLFLSSIFCFGSGVALWALLRESFRHTHYPIRFNRHNRRVYVFRQDGSVLEAPWDELFFTLGRASNFAGIQIWDIRGHVLADDRETVLETFALAVHSDQHDDLVCFWEFIRRYMEEGPEAAQASWAPVGLVCLDVDERHESPRAGMHVLFDNSYGQPLFKMLMAPFYLASALGRILAMRSSRIPQWPAWVEAACRIPDDDPHERDGRSHPIRW